MQYSKSVLATLLFGATSHAAPLVEREFENGYFAVTDYYTICAIGNDSCLYTSYNLNMTSGHNAPFPYFDTICTGSDTNNDRTVSFNCTGSSVHGGPIVSGKPAANGKQTISASIGWEDHGHARVASGSYTAQIGSFDIPVTEITPPAA